MSGMTRMDVRLRFDYINHEGKDSTRIVIPHSLTFRALKPWYPEPTYLMRAYDLDKRDYRDFQLSKMRNIEEIK